MLILHLTHPVCLPGAEARTWSRVHAWLAGPKNPEAVSGHHRQSHTPAEHWPEPGSVTASSCPGVTQRWAVGDRGLWLLLPAPDRAGAGPSIWPWGKQGESLINRGTARWMSDPRGLGEMQAKTNSSAHGKRSRCCRTHLLLMGLKEGQAGNADGFGIHCFWQGRITRLHHSSPPSH